jgi:hypothetical protein
MADNPEPKGSLGIMLGAIVAMAAMLFLIGGGEYFGKKTVESDKDLPPVATGLPGATPETTGVGPATPSPPRRIVVPPPAR